MTISAELLHAIVAMDSYNRGYDAGIGDGQNQSTNGSDPNGLGDAIGTTIGQLRIIARSSSDPESPESKAGFYVIAYEWNGQTIISYRGTDNLNPFNAANDIWNGWTLGAGFHSASQAGLAIAFYEAVVGALDPGQNRTIFDADGSKPLVVGHSMGGGLAGFVSLLSGSQAVGFDHMPFGAAAFSAIEVEAAKRVAGKIQAGELPADFTYEITPALLQSLGMNVPDYANFSSTIVEGETNSGLRDGSIAMTLGSLLGVMTGPWIAAYGGHVANGQTLAETNIVPTQLATYNWNSNFLPGDLADINLYRHKQALLVALQYAKDEGLADWHVIADDLLNAFFTDDIALAAGFDNLAGQATLTGRMQTAIAYSALDEGTMPFGNSAIRAMFNDAEELGHVVSASNVSSTVVNLSGAIAEAIVHYAAHLALNKNQDDYRTEGILENYLPTKLVLSLDGYQWDGISQTPLPDTIAGSQKILDLAFAMGGGTPDQEATLRNAAASYFQRLDGGMLGTVAMATTTQAASYTVSSSYSGAVDMFLGGSGADTVTGNYLGRAIIATGGGNDTVYAKGGGDLVMLGAGDDIAYGARGTTVDGGFDRDTLSFAQSVSSFGVQVFVSGASGTAMVGSSQWPSSTGTSAADYFRRVEHVVGSTSNDGFVVQSFAGVNTPVISLDGGAGQDTIYFQETTRGISLDLSKITQSGLIEGGGIGQPITLHIAGIENVVSGVAADSVIGNSSANLFQLGLLDGARAEAGNVADGGGGDDTIRGGAGADMFRGGEGRDQVYGYYGDDRLEGGAENDQIFGGAGKDELYGDGGNDFVWGGADDDHVFGGAGNDYLYGEAGKDVLEGGDGNDTIEGGYGDDELFGNAGDDIIRGGVGNAGLGGDILDGGAGADQLYGSGGNDRLIGVAGNDYLNGGLGNDTFVFMPGFGRDTVSGFGTNPGDGDIIEIASSLFSSFEAVMTALTPNGSGTMLTVDGSNSIYFENKLSYYDNTGLLHTPFVESDFAFV